MPGYDEFVDPNSAIAKILQQMQGAANRSNPNQPPLGMTPPGGAQPGPVGTGPGMPSNMGMEVQDPQELIEQLLAGQEVNR